MFDKKLKFRSQLNQAVKKGTAFALTLSGIARITWGTPFKYIRRLYTLVIQPKILYGAPIWHQPKNAHNSPITLQIQNLTAVQCLAMRMITGCFRTTPTAA